MVDVREYLGFILFYELKNQREIMCTYRIDRRHS